MVAKVHHIANNYDDKMEMLIDDLYKFRFMPTNMVISIGLAYVLGGNRLRELRHKIKNKLHVLLLLLFIYSTIGSKSSY